MGEGGGVGGETGEVGRRERGRGGGWLTGGGWSCGWNGEGMGGCGGGGGGGGCAGGGLVAGLVQSASCCGGVRVTLLLPLTPSH